MLVHTHVKSISGAGRHQGDILNNPIYEFSNERILSTFRMHRSSFLQLVNVEYRALNIKYNGEFDSRVHTSIINTFVPWHDPHWPTPWWRKCYAKQRTT